MTIPPIVHDVTRSSGRPLDPAIRGFLEPRFGHDFSRVRVHSDERAAEAARAIGAFAYTVGRDIVLGAEARASSAAERTRVIAHELTHVLQQSEIGTGAPGKVSDPSGPDEREADRAAESIMRGGPVPSVTAMGVVIQRDVGWAKRGPLADPYGELLLLNAFAAKFLEAAKLIRANAKAMELMNEAEAAGIQFGGYAEDGPAKVAWAYTVGDTVYVPKARTDAIVAMSDFLFELNNAVRKPQFDENTKNAAAKKIDAKTFARRKVELEVEGMLRMGKIWFDTKKGDSKLDKYDTDFFLAQYQQYKDGKKTKGQIVDEVLKWKNGIDPSKTNEEYYMAQYPK